MFTQTVGAEVTLGSSSSKGEGVHSPLGALYPFRPRIGVGVNTAGPNAILELSAYPVIRV